MGSTEGKKKGRQRGTYWKLFSATFLLSACTFGGGFVIVPLMRKKFVEQLGWIEEQEMLDLIAIARSSPGSLAVNAAILAGYRVAGWLGSVVTVLGTVLPSLLILSAVSFFYTLLRDNPIVDRAMTGMQAGVAAVICDVVLTMGIGVVKENRVLPVLLMGVSFVAVQFFDGNVFAVLAICALVGVIDGAVRKKKGGREE